MATSILDCLRWPSLPVGTNQQSSVRLDFFFCLLHPTPSSPNLLSCVSGNDDWPARVPPHSPLHTHTHTEPLSFTWATLSRPPARSSTRADPMLVRYALGSVTMVTVPPLAHCWYTVSGTCTAWSARLKVFVYHKCHHAWLTALLFL